MRYACMGLNYDVIDLLLNKGIKFTSEDLKKILKCDYRAKYNRKANKDYRYFVLEKYDYKRRKEIRKKSIIKNSDKIQCLIEKHSGYITDSLINNALPHLLYGNHYSIIILLIKKIIFMG